MAPTIKLGLSITENGIVRSFQVELLPAENGMSKPVVIVEDNVTGFRTTTELPARDYSKAVNNLKNLLSSRNLQSSVQKMMIALSL